MNLEKRQLNRSKILDQPLIMAPFFQAAVAARLATPQEPEEAALPPPAPTTKVCTLVFCN